jgi:hypothetical protein
MRQAKYLIALSRIISFVLPLLFCLNCRKDKGNTATTPPTINSFTANPNLIDSGEKSTLTWDISNATQITLDNGVGDVINLTSIKVSPLITTQYTITATNSAGMKKALASIDVNSPSTSQLLYYGGNHYDAVTLDAGTYEAAARFTPSKIGNLVGKSIIEIQYYVGVRPDSIKVKLYGPLDEKTPGNLLYSADVTRAAVENQWNVHTLQQPMTLKNEDIWLSIEFKTIITQKTIGCDPGPAIPDGDWLYSSLVGQWTPLHEINAFDLNINWNIRLKVAL